MISLISIPKQDIQKYLPYAIQLTLSQSISNKRKNINNHLNIKDMSYNQKLIITKIYQNIKIISKQGKKQLKEFLKVSPQYQDAIAQLYFDKHINNTIYISQEHHQNNKAQNNNKIQQMLLLQDHRSFKSNQCVNIQYRIQFTLSSINHKKVMKPLILLQFAMKNGRSFSAYFDLNMFVKLRKEIASIMKDIYTVQMKSF